MEGTIFLDAAVAAELENHWIEARLHTDRGPGTSKELAREQKELEKQLLATVANPYFAVVNPATMELISSTPFVASASDFLAWLRAARGADLAPAPVNRDERPGG